MVLHINPNSRQAVYWVAYVRLFCFPQNGVDAYDCIKEKKPNLLPQTENQARIVMQLLFDHRTIYFSITQHHSHYEVLIATHIDKDHWHNHLIVNSVSCETGLEIQINEKRLEALRTRSDEFFQQFGMEILAPYQKPKQRSMNQREYRAALRGDS